MPRVVDANTASGLSNSAAVASNMLTPAILYVAPPNTSFDFRPTLDSLGLQSRFTPGNGDCLFHALMPDAQPAPQPIRALRQQVAQELAATPDTPQSLKDNAEQISNYLFQTSQTLWESVGEGIQHVPNALRAGLEALPGVYSNVDVVLPLYCRMRDRQAPPGSRPTVVTLLSEADGFAVQFTASERIALPMRALDSQWAASTLQPLINHSDAVVLHRGAHFERVVAKRGRHP